MRTLVITLLALTATCALGDETCDINFLNSGNSAMEMTIMKGQNLDVIMTAGPDWSSFMANGPEDVVFKTKTGTERVTDLEEASVEERLGHAYYAARMMDFLGNRAEFTLVNGQLSDNSFPGNGWTRFTKKQPSGSGAVQYLAQTDSKELFLNVLESTGDYHHIFKQANGLVTVVNKDCSIVTYAKDDAETKTILSLIEEIGLEHGGWEQTSNVEEEPAHVRLLSFDARRFGFGRV